ncbi:MAG: EamA family transporter, partial [Acidimicrobiia bacterium]|nr:EamA family transporter [Acidimicrobiia bacterium]
MRRERELRKLEGILFTLLSAASFGANNVVVRRGLLGMSAGQGLYITVLLGIPLFGLAALLSGQLFRLGDLTWFGGGLLAVAGVVHFVAGRYCTFRAVGAIGANRTMPLQALSGFYSVIIAVIFLDEHLSMIIAIGIVLAMLGPGLIAQGSRHGRHLLDAPPDSLQTGRGVETPQA